MPFEVKTYFKIELRDAVRKIASDGGSFVNPDKRIEDIWERIGNMFEGSNRQKKAEQEVRTYLNMLAVASTTYAQFCCLEKHYNNSDYSYKDITKATLSMASGTALMNQNSSSQIEGFYNSIVSSKPKKHRAGEPSCNYLMPLNDGNVRARDYVNAEGRISAQRPIVEWYVDASHHKRIFTKYGDARAWYTVGGTHTGHVDPEWWISPSPGSWQKLRG
jgi:hypothetical protein